jgi:serine/threonine protein kinase
MAEAGQILAGRFALVEILGHGGMGSVWRARDERLGIDVAVKVLRHGIAPKATLLSLFAQEAELTERMLSRNVVRVIDRGFAEDEDAPYIAFELLEGEDLGKCLDREGALALAECARIVVHVCRALERAHAVGAVHCDIKPENIFLSSSDDLVKVLDFGIASMARPCAGVGRDDARLGGMSGTLEYMSPEQVLEEKTPDARSDLYAVGVVAYRAFTGRTPYMADTLGQLLVALSGGAAPAPSAFRSDMPLTLDPWFERALDRDPDRRFQNAREMAASFSEAFAPKSWRPMVTTAPWPSEPSSQPGRMRRDSGYAIIDSSTRIKKVEKKP